jgi:hypothetical protein
VTSIGRSWRRSRGDWRLAFALPSLALAPTAALAGAWTLPPGEGQIIATVLGWTGSGAPYGGVAAPRESRVEAQVYAEYGIFDRLTLFGEISPERYALTPPTPDLYYGLDYTQLGMRGKFWSNDDWVFSGEASGFVPLAREASRPAQAGDTGGAVEGRLLVGRNFTLLATPAFLDAELGYRFRTAGPPDEWRGDVTIGLKWAPEWMGLLQVFNTISAASTHAEFPAWRSHMGQVSVVHRLDEHWSIQVGAFASVATVKTNSETGVLAALWRRF